jgi:hypothetical protein
MKTFLRAAMPILLIALLVPGSAGAMGPRLQRCDLGLSRPFACGHIVTPMRRADPALGTTRVAFALRSRSERERPSLGTIVAMDGGPGYASSDAPFARSLVAMLAPLLRRHDLVLFDERGTGRSDRLPVSGRWPARPLLQLSSDSSRRRLATAAVAAAIESRSSAFSLCPLT